jgi:hypothetical protein
VSQINPSINIAEEQDGGSGDDEENNKALLDHHALIQHEHSEDLSLISVDQENQQSKVYCKRLIVFKIAQIACLWPLFWVLYYMFCCCFCMKQKDEEEETPDGSNNILRNFKKTL